MKHVYLISYQFNTSRGPGFGDTTLEREAPLLGADIPEVRRRLVEMIQGSNVGVIILAVSKLEG